MRTLRFFKSVPGFLLSLILGIGLVTTASVYAVDDIGLFELDGNAVQGAAPGDDWETLYNGGGSANVFTGVTTDPAPMSIYTGGSKDILEFNQLGHTDGSVPDKNDITNAYAAAYEYDGDLIVYFGADRVSNNGDAFLGFWFFKDEITLNPDGSFSGERTPGDTLVLVNFPQAANAVPLVQVVVWDPTCSKADSNTPLPGDCAAKNLRLKFGVEGPGAVCTPGAPMAQLACAIANDEGGPNDPTPSPWPYMSKDGFIDEFPYETFFEGGINLTELIGGDTCFSSFMAESRASSSFTAQLKDLVLDAFPVCGIEVTKACTNPQFEDSTQTSIVYDIAGTVTNTGFGTVYNVNVTDDPPFDVGSLNWSADPASLEGGASINYTATITVGIGSNGPSDTVTATANTKADDTGTTLDAEASADCPALTVNPAISVTKDCSSAVTIETLAGSGVSAVVAQVDVSGQVCNDGDSNLYEVSVVDNKAGTLLTGATLLVGECESYTGSYIPTESLDYAGQPTTDPTEVWFRDTVSATAVDIFGDDVGPATADAECPLCACPECEEPPQ